MSQKNVITVDFEREKFAREWAASHGGEGCLPVGRRIYDLRMAMRSLDVLKNEITDRTQDIDNVETAQRIGPE